MKANSFEVAKKAGVSQSTVSRVINGNKRVVPETRERVLKAMKELNFIPNTSAQALAGKKSSVIGLFIFDKEYDQDTSYLYYEYFLNFIATLSKEVFSCDHQLLIDVVHNQESEQRLLSLFENRNIISGIFLGASMNNSFINDFIKIGHKVALVDYSNDTNLLSKNVSLINTADYEAAKAITNCLIDAGCKRILHIAGDKKKLSANERESGYKAALKLAGLKFSKKLILAGDYHKNTAYLAMKKFLKEGHSFDGIFAGNDVMAHGALQALKEASIEGILIWGFDNLRNSISQGIMSADPCVKESATKAIKTLIDEDSNNSTIQYTTVKLIKCIDDDIE